MPSTAATTHSPLGLFADQPQPRLYDRVLELLRLNHYSRRTEDAYVGWIRRFLEFHQGRHPRLMAESEVTAFLSDLAVRGRVAASTQNQALSALLFLYQQVLEVKLPWLDDVVRAKRPKRLPVVLSREEVQCALAELKGTYRLIGSLLYGSGLRFWSLCDCGLRMSISPWGSLWSVRERETKVLIVTSPNASSNALLFCSPGIYAWDCDASRPSSSITQAWPGDSAYRSGFGAKAPDDEYWGGNRSPGMNAWATEKCLLGRRWLLNDIHAGTDSTWRGYDQGRTAMTKGSPASVIQPNGRSSDTQCYISRSEMATICDSYRCADPNPKSRPGRGTASGLAACSGHAAPVAGSARG